MSRNLVEPPTAEHNREQHAGRYTFHAPISMECAGEIGFSIAVLRVGDHAHLEVHSGRAVARNGPHSLHPFVNGGKAGNLILRWEEWLVLRPALDAAPFVHIAEVENPTVGQIRHHVG